MNSDEIINLIILRYYQCPNVENDKCYTWWKHDDCTVLAELLHKITGNKKYDQHKYSDIGPVDMSWIDRIE